jgi:hypothetical protein
MAHDAIIEARVHSTYQANRHRSEEKPFEVGDLAYLSTANLNLLKHHARKLTPKYIGPFRVTKVLPDSSNYELELSEELKARHIHPCFHVLLLRLFEPNNDTLFLGCESKWFYDFGMPNNNKWLIDEIMGHRFIGKSIKFNI